MYVVANCVVPALFVHCTTEQGRMLLPATVRVNAAVPAVAVAGETDAIVGAGGEDPEIVKGELFERAPKLDT